MRRLLGLSLLVCAVISVYMTSQTEAGPPIKVQLCHVWSNRELANGIVQVRADVHSFPLAAVPAHLAHGDISVELATGSTTPIADGTCCRFSIMPNGDIVPGIAD